MACVTVYLVGWDIYVGVNKTPNDTISEIMLGMARRHMLIPFVLGVIGGHFFWPGPVLYVWWQKIIILGGVGLSIVLIDLIDHYYPLPIVAYLESNPAPVAMLGFIFGHIVWAQQI